MAKMKRITVAGPLVIETVYPVVNPSDSRGVRAGKKAMSSEAQRRMNHKYTWQRLELILAANFGVNDIYATLSYDDDHHPATRERALADTKAFWKKLRKARLEKGQELRYVSVPEHKHGEGRWHHHVFINSTGKDYDLIRRMWPKGNIEFRRIRIDREKNYETLARYLCKEERDKVGQHLWAGSRNLRKPESESFRVPNDTPLTPPESATVLEDTGDVVTAYGHYRYLKYLAGGQPTRHVRAKRRRRRKRE